MLYSAYEQGGMQSGHLLYTQIQCELYNPQYTARFAVIMEAYLKACGESMLVCYSIDQSELKRTLNRHLLL